MREDIEQDEREEIIGELIDAGADINVKTADVSATNFKSLQQCSSHLCLHLKTKYN